MKMKMMIIRFANDVFSFFSSSSSAQFACTSSSSYETTTLLVFIANVLTEVYEIITLKIISFIENIWLAHVLKIHHSYLSVTVNIYAHVTYHLSIVLSKSTNFHVNIRVFTKDANNSCSSQLRRTGQSFLLKFAGIPSYA